MANPFTEMGSTIFGTIFSSIVYFGIAFILIVILGVVMYYFVYYKRKFDIDVKIKSERAGDPSIFFDKAAILATYKDKRKYFRLLNLKVDLMVPPFQVLQKTNKGDYLEIWRKSEDEFVYLTPGRIDRMKIIKSDGKLYKLAETEQKQIESDVDWYLTRKEKVKKLVDAESLLMKILPWIPQIVGGMFMVFILWILMDKLPEILGQLAKLTSELRSLKGAEITTGLIWGMLK